MKSSSLEFIVVVRSFPRQPPFTAKATTRHKRALPRLWQPSLQRWPLFQRRGASFLRHNNAMSTSPVATNVLPHTAHVENGYRLCSGREKLPRHVLLTARDGHHEMFG